MTPKTAEIPAVTNRTTGLVQLQFAGCIVAEQTRQVAGGFERGALGVALLAAKWIVDFGVAYQTIGHLRHGGASDPIGLRQPAMAGLAGIGRVKITADVARWLEIIPLVDGGGKQRRHVAHFEVLCVAEEGDDAGLSGRGDLDIVIRIAVTWQADGLRGQQVVGGLGAGGGRRVTGDALEFQGEVEFMREGIGVGRAPRQQNYGQMFHPW